MEIKHEKYKNEQFQKLIKAVTTIQQAFRNRRLQFQFYEKDNTLEVSNELMATDISMVIIQNKLAPFIPKWRENYKYTKAARKI